MILRAARAVARFFGLFASRLELEHLRWARKELQHRDPFHSDLPEIVRRINVLERVTR